MIEYINEKMDFKYWLHSKLNDCKNWILRNKLLLLQDSIEVLLYLPAYLLALVGIYSIICQYYPLGWNFLSILKASTFEYDHIKYMNMYYLSCYFVFFAWASTIVVCNNLRKLSTNKVLKWLYATIGVTCSVFGYVILFSPVELINKLMVGTALIMALFIICGPSKAALFPIMFIYPFKLFEEFDVDEEQSKADNFYANDKYFTARSYDETTPTRNAATNYSATTNKSTQYNSNNKATETSARYSKQQKVDDSYTVNTIIDCEQRGNSVYVKGYRKGTRLRQQTPSILFVKSGTLVSFTATTFTYISGGQCRTLRSDGSWLHTTSARIH